MVLVIVVEDSDLIKETWDPRKEALALYMHMVVCVLVREMIVSAADAVIKSTLNICHRNLCVSVLLSLLQL